MHLNNRFKNTKTKIIAYSLLGSIVVNGLFTDLKRNYINAPGAKIEFVREISLEDLKHLIFSSPFLSDEEKNYLYNENFLNDILPYINEGILRRIKYHQHLSNMSIEKYGVDDYMGNFLGYYTEKNPNILNVRNYDEFKTHKDTLAHEFIHLCQELGGYNLLTEACAEIISQEYFEDADVDVYTIQVKLVKTLMEIIGPDPIWIYNFTGDFTPIENAVRPYLSTEEYYEFLSCLTFEQDDENNLNKFKRLDELLKILYKNKFDDDIENNEAISALKDSSAVLTRYYFNPRYMNQEHSFYYKRTDVEFGKIDYKTAMERNLFFAYAIKYEPITYEEAMDELVNGTHNIRRDIDFTANDIIIYRSIVGSNETIITAQIDGIKYEEANVDDLVSKGVININYYRIYYQVLSAQDYLDRNVIEGAEINTLYYKDQLTLYDDYIEGYIPITHYLTPINQIGFSRVLKKD